MQKDSKKCEDDNTCEDKESTSERSQHRRLLAGNPNPASAPTGKLTQQAIPANDVTVIYKDMSPIEFKDWEGESRTIKSRELKKNCFCKRL